MAHEVMHATGLEYRAASLHTALPMRHAIILLVSTYTESAQVLKAIDSPSRHASFAPAVSRINYA